MLITMMMGGVTGNNQVRCVMMFGVVLVVFLAEVGDHVGGGWWR